MTMKRYKGATVMLVLVFMGVFGLVVTTLSSYLLTQAKAGRAKLAREQALGVAEAGLEYYRWFLAHYPNNLQNGTGLPGPYAYTVTDPEGGTLGTASISVTGQSACGVVQAIQITATGTPALDVQYKRALMARYARPSVAEYSHIINSNVWAGADRAIVGPYHSNGGIRMDGTNNSIVSSPVPTWLCTSTFGCSPNQTVSGVWGSGSGSTLWRFPPSNSVNNFNFGNLAVNLAQLKSYAQTQGLYFNTVSTSGQRGYRMVLRSDGTVDVYRVTGTNWVWAVHVDDPETWVRDYVIISSQTYLGRYTIPTGCSVIVAEDNIWLEGTTNRKVTIVAGDPEDGSFNPNLILQGNISYTTVDGSVGITGVAEQSVWIGHNIPDSMSVRGVYVAQNGYYGRNLYPCWYAPYDQRSTYSLHGSVISNGRVGTKWTYSASGCGTTWSGFNTRNDTYDRLLAFDPPPFTPAASPDYKFIIWREQ